VNIAVLASHAGTTLQAVLDGCAAGAIASRVCVVISNNAGAGALSRAHAAGVTAVCLSGRTHPDPADLDRAIRDTLLSHDTELVLLLGYMKKLGPLTLGQFAGRILNTHPALLPKFGGQGLYGQRVHQAVLESGELETGVTVHIVTAEYDSGPVVAQAVVPVEPGDTPEMLAARVQAREKLLLVEVVANISAGKLLSDGVEAG
jgi:phosphoribosylglycinamide formyltransferase 1